MPNPTPTIEDWEEQLDSMFDWADQIKQSEIGRWKIMYGFTPEELKQFFIKERELVESSAYTRGFKDGYIKGNEIQLSWETYLEDLTNTKHE